MTESPTRCGNCGAATPADAITCPTCGVLLAAYQSPAGATVGDRGATAPVSTSVTADVPSALTLDSPEAGSPSVSSAVATSSASTSPIAAAMERMAATPAPATPDDAADELAAMAADTSGFAQRVEADLAEAKVVFDEGSGGARIETAPTAPDIAVTAAGTAPVTTTPRPAARTTTPRPARTATATTTSRPAHNPDPNRKLDPPQPPRRTREFVPELIKNEPHPMDRLFSSKNLIPAIVVGFMLLVFIARNPALGLAVAVAIVPVAIFFRSVISASKSTSRTTTRMPKDRKRR